MRRIGGLLGRSPYGPLYEQTVKVTDCVREVPVLLSALSAGDRAREAELSERIHRLEHEADLVKLEIRDHLSNSLFNSVERSEVLLLVSMIDSLADNAEKVGKVVTIRPTTLPDGLGDEFVALGDGARESAERLTSIVGMMRDIAENSSSRSEASGILRALTAFGEHGFLVEEKEVEFLKALFTREQDVGPIDVMLLMKIAGEVAQITRAAENVGDAIRRMVLNR